MTKVANSLKRKYGTGARCHRLYGTTCLAQLPAIQLHFFSILFCTFGGIAFFFGTGESERVEDLAASSIILF